MGRSDQKKAPIRWVGVLFAVVMTMLLTTLADLMITQVGLGNNLQLSAALRVDGPRYSRGC